MSVRAPRTHAGSSTERRCVTVTVVGVWACLCVCWRACKKCAQTPILLIPLSPHYLYHPQSAPLTSSWRLQKVCTNPYFIDTLGAREAVAALGARRRALVALVLALGTRIAQLAPLRRGVGALAAAGCRRGARKAKGTSRAHGALGLLHQPRRTAVGATPTRQRRAGPLQTV